MMSQTILKTSATPRILAGAARTALQWRLLLLWVLWMLIPTAVLALPIWATLSDSLDYSVHAAAIARTLDLGTATDLLGAHGKNSAAFTQAGMVALALTLLISPLLSGMAATAARASSAPDMRALMAGALADYPRMLRMLLWAALPLGLAAAIGGAASAAAADHASDAITAADAGLAEGLASAVLLVLLMLAHITIDAGRAILVLDRRRRSAVKAWWAGCRLLATRPLATFGAYLAIVLPGLGLAALLSIARLQLPGGGLAGFIGALLLTQVIVAVIGWMRCARLIALVGVARTAAQRA